jgi:hypothetical protein
LGANAAGYLDFGFGWARHKPKPRNRAHR